MKLSDIPVPEIYKESADFRFFINWFENALAQIKYDTENIGDLYDPLRCKSELLWMLADTMGFKFDDRLPVAFNRLVLLYFMSMIRYKGSKNGMMLAAEVNLAQFNIIEYGIENDILNDRLEDTSIPINSVYVTSHTAEGYIDVVYFSANKPVDACIEYVRPLGMYCFQHAGVRVDARTKISIDARLTNENDLTLPLGPTHVGHYRRADYASLQRTNKVAKVGQSPNEAQQSVDYSHRRNNVYYRNKSYEGQPNTFINPGYRSLYSLQLCNNEHIVKAMIPSKDESGEVTMTDMPTIFGLGYTSSDVSVHVPTESVFALANLHYDKPTDEEYTRRGTPVRDTTGRIVAYTYDVSTVDSGSPASPEPAVNPQMYTLGDAISLNPSNSQYIKMSTSDDGRPEPSIVPTEMPKDEEQ